MLLAWRAVLLAWQAVLLAWRAVLLAWRAVLLAGRQPHGKAPGARDRCLDRRLGSRLNCGGRQGDRRPHSL